MSKKRQIKPITSRQNVWMVSTVVLAILLVISIITGGFTSFTTLSEEAVAEKALIFINENLLQPGTTASLIEIEEMGNLYNLQLQIDGRTYNSFVTKDAKLLCPSAIPLEVA